MVNKTNFLLSAVIAQNDYGVDVFSIVPSFIFYFFKFYLALFKIEIIS